MSDPLAFAAEQRGRFYRELDEFLRIPSVSAKSEHNRDTRRAADWVRGQLTGAGLTAEVFYTPGHPVVLGEWRGAGRDAPTILIYGHYDVQPPEPLELWDSPPFEPAIRDGRIYARGSADDKGQLFLHIKALEAHLTTRGRLPVNIVVLAEGEEEVGSPNLVPFVREHRDRLAADTVVISDSAMFAPGLPSLLFSLRGLAYFEIHATGPSSDLHSGAYGGAILNPANTLARVIGDLHDNNGRITIPGFYDDIIEPSRETLEGIRALPFDPDEYAREVGVTPSGGERDYSALERMWTRPTCDVNGLLSGYTGEGAKTVLPAKAMAKVSFRLVPGQTPERVRELLERHLARVAPAGVELTVIELHGGRPWRASLDGPVFEAASRALERSFGTRPVLTGEGGSIPIVVELEEMLGANTLLIGFALPGANMHAPNEWFATDCFDRGIDTLIHLYDELAAS
ncbi:MAG: dipeptidase [Gemmatimonadetes bacterium]|nr:dipeptidase [Gemmatimonadota bacterium]MXX71354.1 dipeptidase [Gemmatimonadota bacterium]MYC90063.1 dipeptidase [Gemmatimonadota bacterium]MYG37056.1 dipeptidase [Gemmatimonadota bacterium]